MNDHGLGLTPEQLAHRRNFIGGSDAGDIMAGDWRRLWRIKTGREEEGDLYDRLSATMDYFVLKHFTRERMDLTRLLGHATEDLNAFWYEKQTGRDVGHRRVWRVSRHPDRSFMGANLDGSSTTSHGHFCYWDAKWTGRCDEAFVLRHTPQGVHCATVLGVDWWGLSVFIGNGKWEWIEQEIDPLYQATLIARETEFWGYVTRDEEPPEAEAEPVLAPKPTPRLRSIVVPTDNDEVFEALARQNNWLGEACKEIHHFVETDASAKSHAIARERLKALVPEDVGEFRRGRFRLARTKAGAVTLALAKLEDDDVGS
jgi:hypothetical protein